MNRKPSETNQNFLHGDITEKIIGASFTVLNTLKPGLDEKLYERALVLELESMSSQVKVQPEYPVYYREVLIGKGIPDLIIDEKVVVDCKVVERFNESHEAQIIGYLNLTGLDVGLLVNFKHAKLQWKRIVNENNNVNRG